jgi:ureidoglycolate dehydrogenase (NAD+)
MENTAIQMVNRSMIEKTFHAVPNNGLVPRKPSSRLMIRRIDGGQMKVQLDVLEKQLKSSAEKFVSTEEADAFAALFLDTHLKKSPRMNPIKDAVDDLKVWAQATQREIQFEVEKPGVLLIDFQGLAPALKIKMVHDEIETRARNNGIAAVGYRNSSAIVTQYPWANGLAQRGLIGMAMFNGGTGCTVPYGGTLGLLGTLPMTYSIPTADAPIELDMATTEIPFFQVLNSKASGTPLPAGSAVDRKGRPTTDAALALGDDGVANLLPLGGGFKGYGLAMLFEVLTGALVRSLLSTEQTQGWNPPEYGGLILGFDIGSFTDLEKFKTDLSAMCREIEAQTPGEGFDRIVIPGQREQESASVARTAGVIELSDEVVADLEKLAS